MDDLKAERRELVRMVYETGSLPVTMDTFDYAGGEDRKLIERAIGECDYFLTLTAHKFGETLGKVHALEWEYSLARRHDIPVLALIIDEKARWKASKKEADSAAAKALEGFKKKLAAHPHDTWTGTADLRQKAQSLLLREMNLNPRRGWVPATEAVEASVANELSRLIQENETLKSQIRMQGTGIVRKVREQMRHALKVLAVNKIALSFYYADGENWENTQTFRYLRLFKLLAPELALPKTAADISRFLGNILNPDLEKTVRKDYPAPSNTIKKIMADFTLLKLVKCTGSGDDEAWEMTEYGKEAYAAYRLRQMERALTKK
jgi:hypothetical protein